VAEIIPFEEQGFIPPLGQSIGEAIAEVEACLMSAFAVAAEGRPGKLSLVWIQAHGGDLGSA